MSHQVEEEVLFSDEFNLNYFGYNAGNDIVAWPRAGGNTTTTTMTLQLQQQQQQQEQQQQQIQQLQEVPIIPNNN